MGKIQSSESHQARLNGRVVTDEDVVNHQKEQSDDPIGLIIEQSGFTYRTTFARLFAAYYSMTPSEYRKIAHRQ